MLVKMYSTGIILLLTITSVAAAQIEGLWQVSKSSDVIEIQATNNGLKAKFVDSNKWDHYEMLRNNTYEDRRGNRYYVESSNRLQWQSRDGKRVINLKRAQNYRGNDSRYNDSRYNDDYNYDNSNRRGRSNQRGSYYDEDYEQGYCTSSCSANCSMHANKNRNRGSRGDRLSGEWVNRWRNTVAHVEYDGIVVRMKTNKSRKWITYRRSHARKLTFEDRWGNTIRFKNNGELKWNRSDGRRDIEFRRNW